MKITHSQLLPHIPGANESTKKTNHSNQYLTVFTKVHTNISINLNHNTYDSIHRSFFENNVFISLWPADSIWSHKSGPALARVMACCLIIQSHYLNQYWLSPGRTPALTILYIHKYENSACVHISNVLYLFATFFFFLDLWKWACGTSMEQPAPTEKTRAQPGWLHDGYQYSTVGNQLCQDCPIVPMS